MSALRMVADGCETATTLRPMVETTRFVGNLQGNQKPGCLNGGAGFRISTVPIFIVPGPDSGSAPSLCVPSLQGQRAQQRRPERRRVAQVSPQQIREEELRHAMAGEPGAGKLFVFLNRKVCFTACFVGRAGGEG